jgi:hypothetical protein
MATPGFPLPLRNALAALACEALDADDAHAALGWLAVPAGVPPPDAERRLAAAHLIDAGTTQLLDVHVAWEAPLRAHAARAVRAASAYRASPTRPADAVGRAVVQASALWNQRLFFEVHEVLEAVWQRETGERRHALQGLIQIAVAWHHLAHGNPRGARTLLREGRARLAAAPPGTLPLLDVDGLLADTGAAEAALAGSGPVEPLTPPGLTLR